ncbi:DNA cytosine methyltransferase [Candidatus Poribacteria bacterium]|nr:DNA cytosine methyltransferase [Candidatus Poribacteria bacterium]
MAKGKLKVIDLFAGAGGFGLGFQLAGYEVTCSVEIDQWAAATLRENNPNMKVIQENIQHFQSSDEIRHVCGDSAHVIIGGPPCQGFSVAGPAPKDSKDPRNSLFQDFACWVESLNPQMFVMENVRGILSRKNSCGKKVIEIIQNTFVSLGYSVEVWQLNAVEYGVPQMRERVFIVGNRAGIQKIGAPPKTHLIFKQNSKRLQMNISEEFENLNRAISAWEAISDLPELKAGEGREEQSYTTEPETEFQRWAREKQDVLFNHVAMKHHERMIERFKHIQWGQSGLDAPEEYRARKRSGNGEISEAPYNSNNRRLHPHFPSYTIPASFYSSFIHPYQHRNLTAREAARIQSFPDWYRFMGKRTVVSRKLLGRTGCVENQHLSQYNQIGNAVPPLLAKAIAKHLQKFVSFS